MEETTKKKEEQAFIAGRTETLYPAFRREPKNRRDYIFNPNLTCQASRFNLVTI
jgi:hypothetical protein